LQHGQIVLFDFIDDTLHHRQNSGGTSDKSADASALLRFAGVIARIDSSKVAN
jgi:hypothetical protein